MPTLYACINFRCGSTLLAKMLHCEGKSHCMAEPYPIPNLSIGLDEGYFSREVSYFGFEILKSIAWSRTWDLVIGYRIPVLPNWVVKAFLIQIFHYIREWTFMLNPPWKFLLGGLEVTCVCGRDSVYLVNVKLFWPLIIDSVIYHSKSWTNENRSKTKDAHWSVILP